MRRTTIILFNNIRLIPTVKYIKLIRLVGALNSRETTGIGYHEFLKY